MDTVNGSEGPDLILGGEGNDVLSGGGGDDRIVGDRGTDTMNGGTGDDTLVWNNGDGSDVANGDGGRDDVEVNGAPAAGDVFTVQPNGARIKFDRTNLVPFSIDIGSSETMHANGLGGNDAITVGEVGAFEVTGAGGPGNDTLTGGGSSETFLGRLGQRHDQPRRRHRRRLRRRRRRPGQRPRQDGRPGPRRRRQRLGRGRRRAARHPRRLRGRRPHAERHASARRDRTQPVTIRGGKVKVKRGVASIKVSAPATAPGNSTGTLTVRTAKPVRLAGLKVTLQLGSARYNIAPGASKTLKVKLAKGSRRLAGRNGRLKALAVASTGADGQIAQSSRRLTLALGTATKTRGRHLLSPISMRAPADRAGARILEAPRSGRSPQPKEQA